MPDITFLLPHWIYWGGIAAVPALLMFLSRRLPARLFSPSRSVPMAYFFLLVGGFIGIHRLYVKSWWAAVFILAFVGVIYCNQEERLARNEHSIAKNDLFNVEYDLKTAEDAAAGEEEISALRQQAEDTAARMDNLQKRRENWRAAAGRIALFILFLLAADALLLPRVVRRANAAAPRPPPPAPEAAAEEKQTPPGGKFERLVSRINGFTGEFVCYWTVIAVFVFYYEVIARYIFNSPTIWAHESMFLLFGMQYMLAGGFCLREKAHVRVDVAYVLMPPRARAVADLLTSFFFFVFSGALVVTGWIYFSDSFDNRQVSITEWEISYWPIKFAIPLGGALLLLQGLANVLRDAAFLLNGAQRQDDGR